jgi:hypothetical protein
MFIQTLAAIDATPVPALGLLPAIHDVEVELVSQFNNEALLGNIKNAVTQGAAALVTAEIVSKELILTAKSVGVLSISAISEGNGVLSVVSTQAGKNVEEVTLSVANSGEAAYVINGENNPTLSFVPGNKYTINVNAPGHPFWIQSVPGAYSSAAIYSDGITGNGTESGVIVFEVPVNAPTLYYAGQYHSSMSGSIGMSNLGLGAGVAQVSKLKLSGNVNEEDVYKITIGDNIYTITYGSYQLPGFVAAKGRVFLNDTGKSVVLPESGKWPSRSLPDSQLCGGDGRLLYEVIHKPGSSSYYPQVFERNIYTFSFSGETFPRGEIFDFSRFFYFRLIGNNTTAVWSVIFEAGEILSQTAPSKSISSGATLTSGQKTIFVTPAKALELSQWMVVTGDGVLGAAIGDQKTYISAINTETGALTLTQAATASGQKTLVFTAPVGPNIERINWLPPLMEEKVHLTDLKSVSALGVWIKNHGTREIVRPDGEIEIDPNRNEMGFEGWRLVYQKRYPIPHECLPTSSNFVIRLRIGQFDTENSVSSPKGYAAYLIRADEEDAASADSA